MLRGSPSPRFTYPLSTNASVGYGRSHLPFFGLQLLQKQPLLFHLHGEPALNSAGNALLNGTADHRGHQSDQQGVLGSTGLDEGGIVLGQLGQVRPHPSQQGRAVSTARYEMSLHALDETIHRKPPVRVGRGDRMVLDREDLALLGADCARTQRILALALCRLQNGQYLGPSVGVLGTVRFLTCEPTEHGIDEA